MLLPRDYKTSTISYPVNYIQGHFGLDAPYGFSAAGGRGGRAGAGRTRVPRHWMADNFPRVIAVTFQHPDAVLRRLLRRQHGQRRPVRRRDHAGADSRDREALSRDPEPWARWLTGGSTGGWEALALQIFHPDFFGGTWASCPDPVTFTDVEGVNVYKDENAFYKVIGDFQRTPTVNSREVNGEIRQTAQQRYWMELVNGTHGRSGTGQQDIWQAVFGPIGSDGYFKPLVDSRTGVDRPLRRAVLEGTLRPALLPAAQLADRRAQAGRQAARLRRQHGQLLPRARRRARWRRG